MGFVGDVGGPKSPGRPFAPRAEKVGFPDAAVGPPTIRNFLQANRLAADFFPWPPIAIPFTGQGSSPIRMIVPGRFR